jgi:hypothetical protein
MIFLLIVLPISIGYCEFVWYLIKNDYRPASVMQKLLKFLIFFNFIVAIMTHESGSLAFAVIICLYYMVIIPRRLIKLQ